MYYIIMWALVLIQGLELQVPLQLIHGDASLGSDQKLRATPRQSYCWVIVATRYIGKMTLELHATHKSYIVAQAVAVERVER